ncbi:hypothetical protein [Janthinobacterium lividum]|uniref:hypothetical protein n=1 Tax=Janthinobacterium lividum TaxID=29581 RepID=UPI0015950591|nr:hypothetical protein [Janthinobacterium lividum]QKY07985.1 hypothetical protein G8765_09555 [Janthinobacterium lividum]
MKIKIFIQLLKEFSLPFILAATWTFYSLRMNEITIVTAITIFGPAFFLTSWLVGQIFRVKKQVGVEKSLGDVEERMETLTTKLEGVEGRLESMTAGLVSVEQRLVKLAESLENNVRVLVGHLNGGDSFCYLRPSQDMSKKRSWMLQHCGQFPMQKIHIRLVDIADLSKRIEENFSYDEISIGSILILKSIPNNNEEHQNINVFFQSRNGRHHQEIRFAKVDGEELWAFRVSRDYETLLQVLPENFPLGDEEKKDWLDEFGVSGIKKEGSIDYVVSNLFSSQNSNIATD